MTVDPDDWWAAVIAATPRTGAAIASANDDVGAGLRERYRKSLARFERAATGVVLPCAAIIGVGTRARR
jgi:hypothetical protein